MSIVLHNFVYGPLRDEPFGEADEWSGLRVSMLTGADPRLVVSYKRVVLETVQHELRTPGGVFVPSAERPATAPEPAQPRAQRTRPRVQPHTCTQIVFISESVGLREEDRAHRPPIL